MIIYQIVQIILIWIVWEFYNLIKIVFFYKFIIYDKLEYDMVNFENKDYILYLIKLSYHLFLKINYFNI